MSVIIYINYVRTEDDISFCYAAQTRLLRFSVLNRENALSLFNCCTYLMSMTVI